ncbi:MAG: hypothetical protein AAFY31_05435 [Pseudomonadota bacterium]
MQTRQIDQAAFGVVYGSITVLALLMSAHPPVENPGRQAIMLFLAVFAVALAKAFAEICERVLQSGQSATWADAKQVWQHAQTVLIAANGPTLAFALAATGVISGDMALVLAQILVFGLLAYFGARIGWRVSGTLFGTAVGVAVTGGIAGLVSLLKFVAH